MNSTNDERKTDSFGGRQEQISTTSDAPFRVLGIALVVDLLGKGPRMVLRYPTKPNSCLSDRTNTSSTGLDTIQSGKKTTSTTTSTTTNKSTKTTKNKIKPDKKNYTKYDIENNNNNVVDDNDDNGNVDDDDDDDLFFRLSPRQMSKLFRPKPSLCNQPMTLSVGGTIFCCRAILMDSSSTTPLQSSDEGIINPTTTTTPITTPTTILAPATTTTTPTTTAAPEAPFAESGSTAAQVATLSSSPIATTTAPLPASTSNPLVLFSLIVALSPQVHKVEQLGSLDSSTQQKIINYVEDNSGDKMIGMQTSSQQQKPQPYSSTGLQNVHMSLSRLCRVLEREERRCRYVSIQSDHFDRIRKDIIKRWNGKGDVEEEVEVSPAVVPAQAAAGSNTMLVDSSITKSATNAGTSIGDNKINYNKNTIATTSGSNTNSILDNTNSTDNKNPTIASTSTVPNTMTKTTTTTTTTMFSSLHHLSPSSPKSITSAKTLMVQSVPPSLPSTTPGGGVDNPNYNNNSNSNTNTNTKNNNNHSHRRANSVSIGPSNPSSTLYFGVSGSDRHGIAVDGLDSSGNRSRTKATITATTAATTAATATITAMGSTPSPPIQQTLPPIVPAPPPVHSSATLSRTAALEKTLFLSEHEVNQRLLEQEQEILETIMAASFATATTAQADENDEFNNNEYNFDTAHQTHLTNYNEQHQGNLARELIEVYHALAWKNDSSTYHQTARPQAILLMSSVHDSLVYINRHIPVPIESVVASSFSSSNIRYNTFGSRPIVRPYQTLLFPTISPLQLLESMVMASSISFVESSSISSRKQLLHQLLRTIQPQKSLADVSVETNIPLRTVLEIGTYLIVQGLCYVSPTIVGRTVRLACPKVRTIQDVSLQFSQQFGTKINLFLLVSFISDSKYTSLGDAISSLSKSSTINPNGNEPIVSLLRQSIDTVLVSMNGRVSFYHNIGTTHDDKNHNVAATGVVGDHENDTHHQLLMSSSSPSSSQEVSPSSSLEHPRHYKRREDLLYKMSVWLCCHKVVVPLQDYLVLAAVGKTLKVVVDLLSLSSSSSSKNSNKRSGERSMTTTLKIPSPPSILPSTVAEDMINTTKSTNIKRKSSLNVNQEHFDKDKNNDKTNNSNNTSKQSTGISNAEEKDKDDNNDEMDKRLLHELYTNDCLHGNVTFHACCWKIGLDAATLIAFVHRCPYVQLLSRIPTKGDDWGAY